MTDELDPDGMCVVGAMGLRTGHRFGLVSDAPGRSHGLLAAFAGVLNAFRDDRLSGPVPLATLVFERSDATGRPEVSEVDGRLPEPTEVHRQTTVFRPDPRMSRLLTRTTGRLDRLETTLGGVLADARRASPDSSERLRAVPKSHDPDGGRVADSPRPDSPLGDVVRSDASRAIPVEAGAPASEPGTPEAAAQSATEVPSVVTRRPPLATTEPIQTHLRPMHSPHIRRPSTARLSAPTPDTDRASSGPRLTLPPVSAHHDESAPGPSHSEVAGPPAAGAPPLTVRRSRPAPSAARTAVESPDRQATPEPRTLPDQRPSNAGEPPTPSPLDLSRAPRQEVDRLVDRLYTEFARKVRIERERRGR